MAVGCSEPAERLVQHLEAMSELVEGAPSCAEKSAALTAYLDEHEAELQALMARKGESSPEQARRLSGAASRLDSLTHDCSDDTGMRTFSMRFSKMVLDSL
jgi:hypothetical protein